MKIEIKQSARFAISRPIFFGLCVLVAGIVLAHALEEENGDKLGLFVVEPPTLISLGFEWYVEGDNNHNAAVEVSYRKKAESAWKNALPLLRINKEESIFSFHMVNKLTTTTITAIITFPSGDLHNNHNNYNNYNLYFK